MSLPTDCGNVPESGCGAVCSCGAFPHAARYFDEQRSGVPVMSIPHCDDCDEDVGEDLSCACTRANEQEACGWGKPDYVLVDGERYDPHEPADEGWYEGRAGQRRRKPRPFYWDRAGIHAAFGLFVAACLMAVAWVDAEALLEGILIAALVTFVFWRYEVSEDAAVNDERYSDIGGYLVGLCAALPGVPLVLMLTS